MYDSRVRTHSFVSCVEEMTRRKKMNDSKEEPFSGAVGGGGLEYLEQVVGHII